MSRLQELNQKIAECEAALETAVFDDVAWERIAKERIRLLDERDTLLGKVVDLVRKA